LRKVSLSFSTPAVIRRLVKRKRGRSHKQKKKILRVEDRVKVLTEYRKIKKADVYGEFGLVNSVFQTHGKNRTKIIGVFEKTCQTLSDFESLKEVKEMRSCLSCLSKRKVTMYK
jgi:hypothetical protein